MHSRAAAVSVNPKGVRAYGNTEGTPAVGDAVETTRSHPAEGEDIVRPLVKAEETGRNDQSRASGNKSVRAEEEIAFNADPYVSSGIFQRVIDFVP